MASAFQSGAFQSTGFQADAPPEGELLVYGIAPSGFGATRVQRTLTPAGIAPTLAFGATTTFNRPEYAFGNGAFSFLAYDTGGGAGEGEIYAAGFYGGALGHPTVVKTADAFLPVGIPPGVFGTHVVANSARALYAAGIAPPPQTGPNGEREVPSPFISYRNRTIDNAGGIPANAVGAATTVTHYLRYIDHAGRGYFGETIPLPIVDLKNRTVPVFSVISLVFGTTTVKRRVFITPAGWQSGSFSDNAEVVINTRRLYVLNSELDPTLWGATHIYNYRQDISLHNYGFYDTQWNFPIVYNLKKEVFVHPFKDNLQPDEWPNYYPFVENRNRYVRPFGNVSSRFGISAWVRNKADPIYPPGKEMTLWGAETFIAYRIRTVYPQGWDSFYNTQYSVVWNLADVVAPVGIPPSNKYGRPDPVLNLNRTVKHHSGWLGPEWGVPFVAYGVRTIFSGLFYDVPAAFPEVRHNPYPIAPVGIPWQGQVGGHEVRIFKREVFPYAVNVHSVPWFGEPFVRNRNITVYPYAYEQTTFGLQDIQNYIRYLQPTWPSGEVFGAHLVEFRTKLVTAYGVVAPAITNLHYIRNDSPDPPSSRTITLAKYNGDGSVGEGDGIAPPTTPYVPHQVRLMTFYPEGWGSSRFGSTLKVYSTAIVPKFWQSDGDFGTPYLIFTQVAFPHGFVSIGPDRVPRPAFSPHNIYAPSGDQKPPGYQPDGGGFPVDEFLASWDNSRWPVFGHTIVALKNRVIGPVPLHGGGTLSGNTSWGSADFQNRRKYVLPNGIASLRTGFPVLLGIPQYVNLDDEFLHQGIAPSTVWGFNRIEHYVDPLAPRYLLAAGFDATQWGAAFIELFNREVLPQGIPHSGNPQQGYTSPWGSVLVGFPRRYTIGMGSQTLWGTHVIEYVNRQVWPEGWNNCSLETFSFENYKFPMKVVRKNPPVRPVGFASGAVGECTVSQLVRTVYARSIDGYNSGGHSVKTTATIEVQGWESLLIGDIDRWEADKIKAHGDDMSVVGIPRLLHPLRATGDDSSVVATPRIAPIVAPVGVPNIAFEGPSVTNPFGCTNRVMSPLPILSTQTVSSPVVA